MKADYTKIASDRVLECLAIGSVHYSRDFPRIELRFDLKGTTAGMFCRRRNKETGNETAYFRLNRALLEANLEEFLTDTIPHEVAHYITRTIWGRAVKSHGKEWQSVMTDCFKIEASRCHDMDTSVSDNRPFVYKCVCEGEQFRLTKRMHNQILSGRSRSCTTCKTKLIFSHQTERNVSLTEIPALFISTGNKKLDILNKQKIVRVVGVNKVRNLIFDNSIQSDGSLALLAKEFGLSSRDCYVHKNPNTLPGNITHAIFVNDGRMDRVKRASEALAKVGVKVRCL